MGTLPAEAVRPASSQRGAGAPRAALLAAFLALAAGPAAAEEVPPGATPPDAPLGELTVTTPQPRYVAPTLRDRIGRIWAPVYVNGQGPYRLVLDTGASRSAVVPRVAEALGLPPAGDGRVRLKGVTGSAEVPIVQAEQVEIGDLFAEDQKLLVVADAFGGADGVLATRLLGARRRIHVEFRKDRIDIAYSPRRRPTRGFATIPIRLLEGHVPWIAVKVGSVRARAIIDTGAQQTTANLALRAALERRRTGLTEWEEGIVGVTGDVQEGISAAAPPIDLGGVTIRGARLTYADLYIFEEWGLLDEPTVMLGMDVWGVLDTMIIDYRRRELQVRMVPAGT
jgi:predicted aspartyl protease